jgi:hypothetical protein
LLDEIFYKHQLGPFDLWSFSSRTSLLIFCLDDLSIGDRGVLKSSLPLCWSLNVILSHLVYV